MRLQNHSLPKPELVLEFNGKTLSTDEAHVSEAIRIATDEFAGNGKGISSNPLTLVVKKDGVPDLTMLIQVYNCKSNLYCFAPLKLNDEYEIKIRKFHIHHLKDNKLNIPCIHSILSIFTSWI
ncbi:hypothetical protein VNO77_44397 [Canavalia gladiata]|uniref:Uncharacterized protein n=1 Tax=Canavalia gladiata TaxID=3824 RepID=A0AAN9PQB6_CANGL